MAWDVSFDPVDADEAIDWFAERLILTREQVDELRADVAKRAFYVSGVAQLDVVAEVWDALDGALKDGTTLEDFKAQVGASLRDAWQGDVANPPARIETIFRTNVQSAYTAGRYAQATDPDVIADRPFWMFDAILDDATTEVCEACDGTVRAADDAWWKTHLPPLHFSCRSHFQALTKAQADAKGLTKKPTSIAANDGFGAPPGKHEWEADPSDYPPILWKRFLAKEPEPPPEPEPTLADHIKEITLPENKQGRGLAEAAIKAADLPIVTKSIERMPLQHLTIAKTVTNERGRNVNADYEFSTGTIRLALKREGQFGILGTDTEAAWSVSTSSKDEESARAASLIHEIGHHIHLGGTDSALSERIDEVVFAHFEKRPGGKAYTRYADVNALEYFAECYAAYVLRRDELAAADSGAVEMVERVLELRGIVVGA